MRDIAALLKEVAYFADLDDERRRALAREVRVRRYGAGERILAEGAPCSGLGIVLAGHVKIFKLSEQGREQILRLVGPGRTFNDVPVFDGGANPGNVAAVEPAEIGMLARTRLLSLVEDEPAVARAVIRVLAARLRAMTLMVEDLALRGVTGRVARFSSTAAAASPP